MKKYFISFHILLLLPSCLVTGCESTTYSPNTSSANLQSNSTNSIRSFPYKYLATKKEIRQNNGSYNKMMLYISGSKINIDTLKMFCKMKKDSITDGYFHIITFFVDKKHARFTKYPITSMYGMDADPARYIKADYTYNRINGYSKLTVYDKNRWESKPIEYDIN